ncbi:MAG: TonB C-terminal domain-containing protein [Bdellovibrionales bacterium]|nr:TonB C-terminal domain-containing protein [Bdellovibrionales bacterium]
MLRTEHDPYFRKDSFKKFVLWSAAGHIALFLSFVIKAMILPSEPLQIRSAIRVDLVRLPDKIETPPKPQPKPTKPNAAEKAKTKPETRPKPKAEPTKKEAPKVDLNKKNKDKQNEALNKLKAMQALEKIRKQKEEEKEAAPEYKGNIVHEGNSLTGLDQIEFDKYFSDVEAAVKEHWSLPRWLEDSQLRAQVRVMVDDRGYVIRRDLIASSGNQIFDDLVITTVEQSSPLPPPPARLRNLLSVRGFVINFPE